MRHEGQDGAGHAEQAEDVGLHHEFPIGIFALGDGVGSFGAAGIVDEDVDVGRVLLGPLHESVYAVGADDVEWVDESLGSAGLEAFGSDLFQSVQATSAKENVAAFSGEGAGGGGTKATGCAGDDDPFICQAGSHGKKVKARWRSSKFKVLGAKRHLTRLAALLCGVSVNAFGQTGYFLPEQVTERGLLRGDEPY